MVIQTAEHNLCFTSQEDMQRIFYRSSVDLSFGSFGLAGRPEGSSGTL